MGSPQSWCPAVLMVWELQDVPESLNNTHFKLSHLGVYFLPPRDPDWITPREPVLRWEGLSSPGCAHPLCSCWLGGPPSLLILKGLELLKKVLSWA